MSTSSIILSPEDAEAFVRYTLSEVAKRTPSKHQNAPFERKDMARQTDPGYFRGSDVSERLFVSAKVLQRAGYSQKQALVTVAELQESVGKTKRGRPRVGATMADFISTVESVRSRVNAFAKRKRYPEDVVDTWLGRFLWGREIGAITGSKVNPHLGRTLHEAWLERKNQLRRLGVVW